MTVQTQKIPAVWLYTTSSAYNAMPGGDKLSFLTEAEKARIERIRQARMLYRGKHAQYFIEEQRTQFDFPKVLAAGDREVRLFVPYNLLKLISKKSADLLFGQDPLLRVADELQQASLSALAERANVTKVLYNAAVAGSYEAETFLESCAWAGKVYLRAVDAGEMFPQGELQPDGQFASYLRRQLSVMPGTEKNPVRLLLETTYAAGSIERRLWQLDEHGAKRLELTLDNWPHDKTLLAGESTGVAMNTITWIPNELDQCAPVSDYDGLIELQDELNSKQTQIARVLAKHADPKLAAGETAANPEGGLYASNDVFFFRSKDEIPQYIVWNAELEAAMKDRAFTVNAILIASETSPVLLGLKEGAAPTAYRTLRLEAHNSLTKAQRKATNWKPGIRRALTVCMALENALPGNLAFDRQAVAVEMRDGIPVDENDQANTLATLRSAKLLSIEGGLERLLGDSAAVAKELPRIKEDAAAETPSVFMSEPNEETTPTASAVAE